MEYTAARMFTLFKKYVKQINSNYNFVDFVDLESAGFTATENDVVLATVTGTIFGKAMNALFFYRYTSGSIWEEVEGKFSTEMLVRPGGTTVEAELSNILTSISNLAGTGRTTETVKAAYDKGQQGIDDAATAQSTADAKGAQGISDAAAADAKAQQGIDDTEKLSQVAVRKSVGKNLFNKNDENIIVGKYISSNQGFASNAVYNITGFIEVEESEDFIKSYTNTSIYTNFYDADFVLLPNPTNAATFTIPAGAKYVRTTYSASLESTFQFEKGSTATTYEEHTEFYNSIGTADLKSDAVETEKIKDASVTGEKLENDYKNLLEVYYHKNSDTKTLYVDRAASGTIQYPDSQGAAWAMSYECSSNHTINGMIGKATKTLEQVWLVILSLPDDLAEDYTTRPYPTVLFEKDVTTLWNNKIGEEVEYFFDEISLEAGKNYGFGFRTYNENIGYYTSSQVSGISIARARISSSIGGVWSWAADSGAIPFAVIGMFDVEDRKSTHIGDGYISTDKLQDEAVSGEKIKDSSISATKILSNAVETEKVKDEAVIEPKTTFFDKTKNLFNINDPDAAFNYYVVYVNGNLAASASYNSTGYMPIEEGKTYTRSYQHQSAFYNSDKNYISGINSGESPTFTAPVGACFIRCTVSKAEWDLFQLELGSVSTEFVSYGFLLKEKYLTEYFEASKNLFNIDDSDATLNYYVVAVNGTLSASASYNATGFIPVVAGQKYIRSYEHQTAFYNSSKNYVSGLGDGSDPAFIVPEGVSYVRCTVSKAAWDEFQLELGSVSTGFASYGSSLKDKYLPVYPAPFVNEVVSPLKQYILDNYENSKYFRALFRRFRPQDESYRIEGGEWKNAGEFARVTNPTAETTGVSIKVYNIEFEEVSSISFDVVIGNQATDNGLVNGVYIGDSLSYNASYIVKVNSLLPNLAWDGMRRSYGGAVDGEGRGGWTVGSYFTKITGGSTDSFTPFMHPIDPYKYFGGTDFWKEVKSGSTAYGINGFADKAIEIGFDAVTGLLTSPSINDCMYNHANTRYERWDGSAWVEILESTLDFSFNFAKYRSTWNITQPDIVPIMLGTNDFRSQSSEAAIDSLWNTWKTRVEEIVTSIHADNSATKVAIMIAPSVTGILDNVNGDFTTKQGAMMWYSRKLIIQDFDDREAEGIYLVDAGTSIDPTYGITLNEELPYSDFTGSQRRLTQSNTPHPSTQGYYQLGIPLAAWIQTIR